MIKNTLGNISISFITRVINSEVRRKNPIGLIIEYTNAVNVIVQCLTFATNEFAIDAFF